ncbi:alpha/beta fold hydrolase [Dietzia maris]|uniref:alpha/beta fold hydrolase n=1 Tax=Dietzia maris TaxID=37915 RepID=UPI00223B4B95|nr:alpha/beta hydrolase [Dietzia maris]MCT1433494.1 alpha/beta hydrolase [Dietzia maris]MCT1520570.1 alpha/beta hydrolase [Dietzia maris]
MATSQRTIIAVPGAEYLAADQLDVFAQLHQRDFHVVLMDCDPEGADAQLEPNWQPSQNQADFEARIDLLSAAILAERAQNREVHLFGVGLGATLCVAAAARHRDIASLTVLAGWATSDRLLREHIDTHWALWDQNPELAQRHSSLLEVSAQYRRNLGPFYDPTIPVVPVATPLVLRRLSTAYHVDITEPAGEVRCRTVVIALTRDSKIPRDHSYELFAAIPGSTLVRIEAGHGALLERLSEVVAIHLQAIGGHLAPGVHPSPVHA